MHPCRSRSSEDLYVLLEQVWHELGLVMEFSAFNDAEARCTILRITRDPSHHASQLPLAAAAQHVVHGIMEIFHRSTI
jgi:hypothetical protein